MAALAPNALHELVTAVGMADAGELLALATPEQVQGCLDLEVWDRDRIELSQARPWVATLLELGFEKVGQVWAGLDAEWRALYLQGHTVIYDLTGGEDPDHDIDYVEDPDAPPVWFSPDGAFAVRLLHGEDPARLTMALLDDLYRADLGLARHTLLAARSEPTAELEEQSYRWRSGRLADLGYVDFYDALALFAPLTVEQYAAEPTAPATPLEVDAAPLPVVVAEALLGKSFLARAWDRAVTEAPAAHERLQHALVTLVNTVLAAARVRPRRQLGAGRRRHLRHRDPVARPRVGEPRRPRPRRRALARRVAQPAAPGRLHRHRAAGQGRRRAGAAGHHRRRHRPRRARRAGRAPAAPGARRRRSARRRRPAVRGADRSAPGRRGAGRAGGAHRDRRAAGRRADRRHRRRRAARRSTPTSAPR